jgi:phosphoribosyl 1,2-cyclic phosphodiesterase
MKVRFWGTRGSLPRSFKVDEIRSKISRVLEMCQGHDLSESDARERFIDSVLPFALRGSYGGNTSCVEICEGDEPVLCDAGSGLRDFGNRIMSMDKDIRPHTFHILLSHLHWDHIQGFPFFTPAYAPGNTVNIYGFHPDIEKAFSSSQEPPFFPVPLNYLGASITFNTLSLYEDHDIGGFCVRGIEQDHPGKSYGYSISRGGKKVVYSTDSEHKDGIGAESPVFVDFFADSDVLIFDAQYSLAEAEVWKRDWGHSSNIIGVELAVLARVKHLVLFHTEPTQDDDHLDRVQQETQRYAHYFAGDYPLLIDVAYDGLEIDV